MSTIPISRPVGPPSISRMTAKVAEFVAAGSAPLHAHHFAARELEKAKSAQLMAHTLVGAGHGEGKHEKKHKGDREERMHYRLNQTGNIFYATTTEKLEGATKELFDSVTVLFAAMTKALSDKHKTLFDYDAWTRVIAGSGFFVEVQKYRKTLHIESGSLTLDTQVIQQLVPGLAGGSSLEIAKGVLSAINGEYAQQKSDSETKFGHILFICEELFGAPSVTVRIFYASKKSHSQMTSSPCHKTVSTSFDQQQEGDTFLFVSPEKIAKYAGRFTKHPEEYTRLVSTLGELVAAG